jgi:hypothetical protein
LAAQGACDCTWQSWVPNYLAKLNIIEAAAFFMCTCAQPKLSAEQKNNLLEWATEQIKTIRDGEIAVCEGDTGKDYPAVGWAEIAHTAWEDIEIADNYRKRAGT